MTDVPVVKTGASLKLRQVLNSSNFKKWSCLLKIAARARNLGDIFDVARNDESKNAEAMLLLCNNVDDDHLEMVADIENPTNAYEKFRSIYGAAGIKDFGTLDTRWNALQLTSPVTVQKIIHYTAAISSLAHDFKTCGETYTKSAYQQGYKAAKGLPTECQQLQFTLLHSTAEDTLNLKYVEQKLISIYKEIEASVETKLPESSNSALLTTNFRWSCYRCGKPGHRAVSCQETPRPGWDDTRYQRGQQRGRGRGGRRGGRGRGRGGGRQAAYQQKNTDGGVAQMFAMMNAFNGTSSLKNSITDWILDSAVSAGHICIHKDVFCTYIETPDADRKHINPFGGRGIEIEGYGDIKLPLKSGNTAHLKQVAYAPKGSANLISTDAIIQTMDKEGYMVNYMQGPTTSKVVEVNTKKTILTATRQDGLHYLDIDTDSFYEMMSKSASANSENQSDFQ